jgi:hypothetical protein
LKNGLAAPLGGMGIAFSSSLFGLAGSLILGFLDLQAGQAQNRFYTDLEDWLSTTVRDLGAESADGRTAAGSSGQMLSEFTSAVERLEQAIDRNGAGKATTQLTEHLKTLVQHMRQEQQMVREWLADQGEQQSEIRKLLDRLSRAPAPEKRR